MTRILVVEDEASYRESLEVLLSQEGFQVVTAATGSEALTKFDQGGIDFILLDLMLPEVSGTEVCRRIRAKSEVPIIMLTAKDSEVDKVVGLEIGADDYVTKPFSTPELLARIRAALRRRVRSDETLPVLHLGEAAIDFTARTASRGWRGRMSTISISSATLAQPVPGRTYRIGLASFAPDPGAEGCMQGFFDGLRTLGFEEGRNLEVRRVHAQAEIANIPGMLQSLDGLGLVGRHVLRVQRGAHVAAFPAVPAVRSALHAGRGWRVRRPGSLAGRAGP